MSEAGLLRRIMLACSKLGGVTLFRNSVGALQDKHGQWIRYGVCNPGGSDLIGWQSFIVQPEDVGQRVARFVAVEVKTSTGRATPEQLRFIAAVERAGGIAAVVRSEAEAEELLRL